MRWTRFWTIFEAHNIFFTTFYYLHFHHQWRCRFSATVICLFEIICQHHTSALVFSFLFPLGPSETYNHKGGMLKQPLLSTFRWKKVLPSHVAHYQVFHTYMLTCWPSCSLERDELVLRVFGNPRNHSLDGFSGRTSALYISTTS